MANAVSDNFGYGNFFLLQDRPVLTFTVEAGEDLGETVRLDQPSVSFGSGLDNDFQINDAAVAQRHGLFQRTDRGYLFHADADTKLWQGGLAPPILLGPNDEPVSVSTQSLFQVGDTRFRIGIMRLHHAGRETGTFRLKVTQRGNDAFMAAQKSGEDSLHLEKEEKRLAILSDLAAKLNKLTHLGEINQLVSKAAFDLFRAGFIFSINRLDGADVFPLLVQLREDGALQPEVVLSRSVLQRVIDGEEAVLFVRGEQEINPSQSLMKANITSCMYAPLISQKGLFGVMQMDTRGSGRRFTKADLALFNLLASHAAFALERANLIDQIYRMFEGFVEASVVAIEARDPTTAGHSERVAKYSISIAEMVNRIEVGNFANVRFSAGDLTELRYAALLHDFGKVGVREAVLMKSHRVSDEQMENIIQRFQLMATWQKEKMTSDCLNQILGGFRPKNDPRLLIKSKTEAFGNKLQQVVEFLAYARRKYVLDQADIQKIKQIGSQKYISPLGEEVSFLTQKELNDFLITKGTLNENEWTDMRSHVAKSETYLKRIPWSEDLKNVPCIAGAHHEKLDGSGYPRGLLADEIPPRVRILTIADIFDAVTAWDRPYFDPMPVERAVGMLQERAAAGQLDKDLVNLFETEVLKQVIHIVPRK